MAAVPRKALPVAPNTLFVKALTNTLHGKTLTLLVEPDQAIDRIRDMIEVNPSGSNKPSPTRTLAVSYTLQLLAPTHLLLTHASLTHSLTHSLTRSLTYIYVSHTSHSHLPLAYVHLLRSWRAYPGSSSRSSSRASASSPSARWMTTTSSTSPRST